MKQLSILVVLLGFLSCQEEEPIYSVITQSYSCDSIASVYVASGVHLYLSKALQDSFRIEITEDLIDIVDIDISTKALNVNLYPNQISGNSSINIYMPYLGFNELTAVNGGKITMLDTITNEDYVDITVGRNSVFEGYYSNSVQIAELFTTINGNFTGELEIDKLYVVGMYTSLIDISGCSNYCSMQLEFGGADFKGYDFETTHLNASVYGNATAEISVSETLEALTLDNGKLFYKGNPKEIDTASEGASEILRIE